MTIYFVRPATTWVLSQQADKPYEIFAVKKPPLHKMKLKLNSMKVSFLRSEVIITQEPESLEGKKSSNFAFLLLLLSLEQQILTQRKKKKN